MACLKFVDRRPEVDRLTGAVHTDRRTSGASDADGAALEWALRAGEAWSRPVLVVTGGPPDGETMLRDALAAGATGALRVDVDAAAPSDSVAAAVATAIRGAALVVCGAWSLDRGSGSFPAFLAAELDAAQALGLVGLTLDADTPGVVRAERRLDGGRRERLTTRAPAVVSVEASTARLRRASLDAMLRSGTAKIDVVDGPTGPTGPNSPSTHRADRGGRVRVAPLRPRPRERAAPGAADARGRILELTGAAVDRPAVPGGHPRHGRGGRRPPRPTPRVGLSGGRARLTWQLGTRFGYPTAMS